MITFRWRNRGPLFLVKAVLYSYSQKQTINAKFYGIAIAWVRRGSDSSACRLAGRQARLGFSAREEAMRITRVVLYDYEKYVQVVYV